MRFDGAESIDRFGFVQLIVDVEPTTEDSVFVDVHDGSQSLDSIRDTVDVDVDLEVKEVIVQRGYRLREDLCVNDTTNLHP